MLAMMKAELKATAADLADRDLGHKQRGCHRARVGYYWLVDPLNLSLTVLRWHEVGYQSILAAGPGDVVRAEPFDAIELDMSRIFTPG